MKKILALLLALILVFTFAACNSNTKGNNGENSNAGSSQVPSESEPVFNTGIDDNEDPEEDKLVLDGTDEYVVCALEDSDITLNSIKDIKGKKVASIYGTDGEKIVNYYGAVLTGFGSPQDGISAFKAKNFDLFIMKKGAAKSYESQGIKIILDPIVIE
ncbi:MAG: hypothetical protein E7568_06770 [Ruminococcaceae bacterium]|nr:hypothetical protein [Oscillospiraceae bacterium]